MRGDFDEDELEDDDTLPEDLFESELEDTISHNLDELIEELESDDPPE